jgi:hypothetical protein
MNGYHIREALRGLAVLLLIGALILVAGRILAGCKAPEPGTLPRYCTEEALYTAKLLRCVDDAKTLAESQQCRANVDYSCGIIQTITVKK